MFIFHSYLNGNYKYLLCSLYLSLNFFDAFVVSAGLGQRAPGCGISDSVQSWMDEVRHSGEKTELPPPQVVDSPTPVPQVVDEDEQLGPQYKYSMEANDPSRARVKRSLPNPNSKKSCALYIQTDPLFWKHIREQVRFFDRDIIFADIFDLTT